MSVFVIRAFVKMRALLGDKRELAKQRAALEKELKQRLDIHEAAIVTVLQRVMDLIDPPSLPPPPPKPRIGFYVVSSVLSPLSPSSSGFCLFRLPRRSVSVGGSLGEGGFSTF